jgi:hypothetical protein
VKLEKDRNKEVVVIEEPRRCPGLKNQEDADMTDLVMKMAAKKNEIPGTNTIIPTVINCNNHLLVSMTKKLGICSDKTGTHDNIVSVIKN